MTHYQTKNNKAGFTLLIAIVTTSMLLVVSFVVANIALKQLVLANTARESQYAFYGADSGTECAVFWDLPKDGSLSKFDTSTAGTIICNGQTISTGSQTINTIPSQVSVVGGSATSIFQLNLTKGCAIVRVTKTVVSGSVVTTVDSRGYNTCDTGAPRRYERGVTLAY